MYHLSLIQAMLAVSRALPKCSLTPSCEHKRSPASHKGGLRTQLAYRGRCPGVQQTHPSISACNNIISV